MDRAPKGSSSIPPPLAPAPAAGRNKVSRRAPGGFDADLIGGIATTRITSAGLADQMVLDVLHARMDRSLPPKVVIASNGSVIARYHRDPDFRALVDQADLVDPDGMPLVLVTRLLWRRPLVERVATTDFIHDAARIAATMGLRFYFLGGKPGIAARAADNLRSAYPGLQIVGTRDGYFAPEEAPAACAAVVASGADILWLGLGSPMQERFAIEHRHRLAGIAWIRTCGGLFDHTAGSFRRAPGWMQKIGLEWLHRATMEPSRLGLRYLATNPPALYHLLTKTRERPARRADDSPAEET